MTSMVSIACADLPSASGGKLTSICVAVPNDLKPMVTPGERSRLTSFSDCSGHFIGTVVVPVKRPTGPPTAVSIIPIFHFCTSASPKRGPRAAAAFSSSWSSAGAARAEANNKATIAGAKRMTGSPRT